VVRLLAFIALTGNAGCTTSQVAPSSNEPQQRLRSVITGASPLAEAVCNGDLLLEYYFVVDNGTVAEHGPHLSGHHEGPAAVARLPEVEKMLRVANPDFLRCAPTSCEHPGLVDSSEFAFTISRKDPATPCVSRIVVTRHELQPQLHVGAQ
jgi:hypothetical protein